MPTAGNTSYRWQNRIVEQTIHVLVIYFIGWQKYGRRIVVCYYANARYGQTCSHISFSHERTQINCLELKFFTNGIWIYIIVR